MQALAQGGHDIRGAGDPTAAPASLLGAVRKIRGASKGVSQSRMVLCGLGKPFNLSGPFLHL